MDNILNKSEISTNERFRDLIEGLNVISYEFDLTQKCFRYVSRKAESILGYDKNEWFTKGFWYDHLYHEDKEWAILFSKHHIELCKDHEYEYRMIAIDGSIKWFKDIVSITLENGKPKSLYGVMIDLTERKIMEKELLESKERYKTLVEQQSEMITRWKPDGTFTYVNDVYCKYFDKSRNELIGKKYIPQMPVEDLERFSRFFASLNKENRIGHFTHRIIKPDGDIRWLRWTDTVILDDNGEIFEYQTVGRDVTARKRAEAALKKSEQQFQMIFDNAPIGMSLTDMSKNYIKVNKAYCDIVGYSKKELANMTYEDITHPEDISKDLDVMQQSKNGTQTHFHYEKRYIHKNGKIIYADLRVNILRDYTGKTFQRISQLVDITEKIEAELKLKQTQARLAAILNNLPNVAIYEYGENVNFVTENIFDILGYTSEEFMNDPQLFSSLMNEEEIKIYDNNVAEWKKSGAKGVLSNEIQVKAKNNNMVWIEDHMFLAAPENNKPYYSGIMIDITEQKKTRLKVLETETKLSAIIKNLPKVVIYQSGAGTDFISENIFEMTGYLPSEILTEKYFFGKIIHPDDLMKVKQGIKQWHKCFDDDVLILEFRIRKSDGSYIWIEDHMFRVRIDENNSYLSGILIDVTDRKIAEEKINKSLKEKELLLKEIHHRVKNNLQVVSSLLKLQSSYVNDEESLDQLIDCQNRVKSMALVHQKLYQSKDFSDIDFKEYIIQLTNYLLNVFNSNINMIKIYINAENINLSIDKAIPCGLILNELISNSLKYAFPDGRRGEINVVISNLNNGYFELYISDNGIGFPDKINFKQTHSLGLQLVNTLVEQIDGSISMESINGTSYRIKFEN